MKPILQGIATWSWFSEEKQINFNGHLLDVGEHRILVDPPPLSDADLSNLTNAGQVDYILLTNRDHERESTTYKDALNTRVYVPQADAPEMSVTSDKTFVDGELLPGGILGRTPLRSKVTGRIGPVPPTRTRHSDCRRRLARQTRRVGKYAAG